MRSLILLCIFLAAGPALAQTNTTARAEQIRTGCIQGRRIVCGRILQITPTGLVVDSGYPALLLSPLNLSWLVHADAAPARPAQLVEKTTPDSIAVGPLFLTDIPRRQVPHLYDYVVLHGYPAGQYDYIPVPGITNRIRRFAGGLDTAVRLNELPAAAAN